VADATVTQQRHEESLILADQLEVARPRPLVLGLPWKLAAVWAGLVILLAWFLLFGSVRISAGNWNGRRMRVPQIWDRFLEFLAGQGFSPGMTAVITLSAVLAIAGSAVLLWFAFGLRSPESHVPAADAPTR
jgi:hypothetical protein